MAYSDIKDPSAYFHTQTYTGTGPNQDVVNDAHSGDFKPDILWIKNRTWGNYGAVCYDSSRGVKRQFYFAPDSYGDDAEAYNADGQSSVQLFNTNGFRGGSSTNIYQILWINGLDAGYVAWQWQVNGGTTSSNSDGNISSTVQVNQDAGLSIVQWTGTGSGTADPKIGHGLGTTPNVIFVKARSQALGWVAYHSGIDGTNSRNKYILPHDNDAAGTLANYWGTAASGGVTSSTFGVYADNQSGNNYLNSTYVAYCFAEKQGFSKFGSYIGNGNDDGPFVYTGFKPAFLLMKRTDSTGNWVNIDNKRDPSNVSKHRMFQNLTNSDNTTRNYIDLLSNGFKMRNTDVDHNASGATIIYMAFAENPFVAGGIPTTAR